MARGNRKSNSKDPADWNKFEFVEIRLTDTDKTKFKQVYESNPDALYGELDNLSKNGYKVSLTYDTGNNCCIASLTCREPGDPNFNYILSARSGDVWEALALVIFKHTHLSDDGDWGAETQINGRSWG